MLVQYLAAKVGLVTGQSLPELCRAGTPRRGTLSAVAPGGNRRDGDRPGRVRGRRDRAQPALRRAAVPRRPGHRGHRLRAPGSNSAATAVTSWRSSPCSPWSALGFCYLFFRSAARLRRARPGAGPDAGRRRDGEPRRWGSSARPSCRTPSTCTPRCTRTGCGRRPPPSARRCSPSTSGTAARPRRRRGVQPRDAVRRGGALPAVDGGRRERLRAHSRPAWRSWQAAGGPGVRRRAAGVGAVLVHHRHPGRTGRHGRLHRPPYPADLAPGADRAAVARRPRHRGQPGAGAALLAGRLVVRHPVRAVPAADADQGRRA